MSETLCPDAPRRVIGRDEQGYPPGLNMLPSPPRELFVLGRPQALLQTGVSIVGARKATPYGLACAQLAARACSELGVVVTSGAAVGCDQAAQREALARGATVVAVLGSGADVAYPASSRDLLEGIVARGGAVVSLQPWGSPPARWAFVRRNAVIAALSRALVICEAGLPSGTFSTAEAADQAGVEVLVFPGSFFSPNSRGSNFLLSQSNFLPLWDRQCLEMALARICGARPAAPAGERPGEAAGAGDVPGGRGDGAPSAGAQGGAAGAEGGAAERAGARGLEARVLRSLEASACQPQTLSRSLGLDAATTMRVLGALDARGLVERLVDGRYSLTQRTYVGGG